MSEGSNIHGSAGWVAESEVEPRELIVLCDGESGGTGGAPIKIFNFVGRDFTDSVQVGNGSSG
jgi:hypothetical protein